jgi:hypothetical protein
MKAEIDRKSVYERIAGRSAALGALVLTSVVFATSCKSSGSNAEADGSAETGGAVGSAGTTGSGGSAGASGAGGTSGTSGVGGASGTAGTGGSFNASGAGGMNGGGSGAGGTSGTGGTSAVGGAGGTSSGGASAEAGTDAGAGANPLPGDIAAAAGTPMVAAHSMTRALYAAYDGALFQVRRASDGNTQDIHPMTAGGYAAQDALSAFCTGTTCSVSLLYDQSDNGNDLPQSNPTNQPTVQYWTTSGGTKVPMAVTAHQQWLRNRTHTHKIPIGSASQTEYMVVHGAYFNNGCCYDYGNMEANVGDDGAGTMSALYFGSDTDWTRGTDNGPWAMADYENGLFSGNYADPNMGRSSVNPDAPSLAYPGNNIVTVLSKTNGTTSWALKAGNAATGPLNTYWNGALPNGYSPLQQQGGLSLGEGGDGSNSGTGAFSEGVVIADVTTDATDDRIRANLTSVYGR